MRKARSLSLFLSVFHFQATTRGSGVYGVTASRNKLSSSFSLFPSLLSLLSSLPLQERRKRSRDVLSLRSTSRWSHRERTRWTRKRKIFLVGEAAYLSFLCLSIYLSIYLSSVSLCMYVYSTLIVVVGWLARTPERRIKIKDMQKREKSLKEVRQIERD